MKPLNRPKNPVTLALLLVTALLLPGIAAPAEAKSEKEKRQEARIEELSPKYQRWLREVEVLMSEEELEIFLELEKDYHRDAFIEEFWKIRDPYPNTARNEMRDDWEARLEFARTELGGIGDERAKILLLNGRPDARVVVNCPEFRPIEVWYYDEPERIIADELFLIFYRHWDGAPFRLWTPMEGLQRLSRTLSPATDHQNIRDLVMSCRQGDALGAALGFAFREGKMGYPMLLMRAQAPLEKPSGEWINSFTAYSTDLPEEAATFPAQLEVTFPGRRQTRTVVQAALKVPAEAVGRAELAGAKSANLLLNGEIVREEELFDRFRYKFDFPQERIRSENLPLVFQRYLRPGEYRLVLKLEDLNGDRYHRTERIIDVPSVQSDTSPASADPETAKILEEANRAISQAETSIELVEPVGRMQVGKVRFDALTTDPAVDRVEFRLDGTPVLTKTSPPYSVELDLGKLPRSQTLSAVAVDEDGESLARDEILLNASSHRFDVRILEPRPGARYSDSLRAEVSVEAPEDRSVERVELYLNEDLVATLYQPPWEQPIVLQDPGELAYVRAVAYLPDGNSSDDHVFINAPPGLENIDVQLVELYASVEDRNGRPVEGLTEEDFTVYEDEVRQEIRRFEKVDDLPFYATVLLDVSASMEEELEETQAAALSFFQEAITPRDRAALVTFNDRPRLAQKFTNELLSLGGGLAGLKAERGTALYDSIVFSLFYNNGIDGQRALLLLSDGEDESSKFTFDETLEFARRTGVTIYSIGLGLGRGGHRKELTRIAEETGGDSFFVDTASELVTIYQQIEDELRSQYLIAYQSSNTEGDDDFREVRLEVTEPGLEAETIRGYYP
ncbi:MAG: VWA domain-containing protein [Thermoanaerobaculia bacterium]|nr:VWA domain-containing protein [Thermoanaerobaculia bacterium]